MEVLPARETFDALHASGQPQVVWTRLIDDLETPVSAYLKIGLGRPFAFLFEAVEGGAWRGRYSIITLDPDLVWRCRGDEGEVARGAAEIAAGRYRAQAGPALDGLRALLRESEIALPDALPPMAAGLFGSFGYDMIRLVEPVGQPKPDALGLPDAVMTRPSIVAVFDSMAQEILLVTPVRDLGLTAAAAHRAAVERLEAVRARLRAPLPRPGADPEPPKEPAAPLASPVGRADYRRIVEQAKRYIEAGDVFQLVASHRFRAPFTQAPFACYRALRRLNPSPFLFFLDFGDFQLAGSSPEVLVRVRDGTVTIRPIAGTRPRGATPEEDRALERDLLADPKERAEHLMLLDLGRNDVGRIVKAGDRGLNTPPPIGQARVRVTDSFFIERYSSVMHIVSNVEGELSGPVDPVEAILTALPAGTLSGAPKVRAMQIIDELETEKRGMAYAGAAGYISSENEVDTCIVLRTALFKDGVIHVQAGGGIVADSDPDAEYEETLHKSRALRRAAEEAWRFA